MQADKQTCESHHQQRIVEHAEPLNAIGKLSSEPVNESSHANALQCKCQGYEDDRYRGSVEKSHRVHANIAFSATPITRLAEASVSFTD